jgi:hypothetical protein
MRKLHMLKNVMKKVGTRIAPMLQIHQGDLRVPILIIQMVYIVHHHLTVMIAVEGLHQQDLVRIITLIIL